MSYRGYQSTNGGDDRNDGSRIPQTVANNVQKISQNVNQMQRMVNQLDTSRDSVNLRTQLWSNFYNSKTVFGGANVTRAARLAGTTPYSLAQRHNLAPMLKVDVRSVKRRIDSTDELSTASKRIFEKLEKASTPLQDARRSPYYSSHGLKDYFKSCNNNNHLIHPNKRTKFGTTPAPPTRQMAIPSQVTVDERFPRKRFELKQIVSKDDKTVSATETIDQLFSNSCDKYSFIESKTNDLKDIDSNKGFGGKMMRKDQKRDEKRPIPRMTTDVDQQNDSLSLLSNLQPLTMDSLPTFNFNNPLTFGKSSEPKKTTLIERVEVDEKSDEKSIQFTEPVLKISERKSNNFFPNGKVSNTADNLQQTFVFSSPKGAITDKSTIRSKTTEKETNVLLKSNRKTGETTVPLTTESIPNNNNVIKQNGLKKTESIPEKWICVCLYQNTSSSTVCQACNKDRNSHIKQSTLFSNTVSPVVPISSTSTTNASNVMSGWGDKFKAPTGSWSCSTCCVTNNADKTKCVACEEPKPGVKPTVSTNAPPTLPSILSTSSWGDRFKTPTGNWVCDSCMVSNGADKTHCVACEASKPGAESKENSKSGESESWNCCFCGLTNEKSKTSCTKCDSIPVLPVTKAGLTKLYGGQTFNFGIPEKTDFKTDKTVESLKPTEDKNEFSNNLFTTNPLLSLKSTETTSQTSTNNVFGSTAVKEIPKFAFEPQVSKPNDVLSASTESFKFGLQTAPNKSIADTKQKENQMSNFSDIFGSTPKTDSPGLFKFGVQPMTTTAAPVVKSETTPQISLTSNQSTAFGTTTHTSFGFGDFNSKTTTETPKLVFGLQVPKLNDISTTSAVTTEPLFKFGSNDNKTDVKTDNVIKTVKPIEDKKYLTTKSITNNPLFFKSTESPSQTSTTSISNSNAFIFGSTPNTTTTAPKPSFPPQVSKLNDTTSATTSETPFKFGLQAPTKPIADIKPTEKSSTGIPDIFGSAAKTNSSTLFQFGGQPTSAKPLTVPQNGLSFNQSVTPAAPTATPFTFGGFGTQSTSSPFGATQPTQPNSTAFGSSQSTSGFGSSPSLSLQSQTQPLPPNQFKFQSKPFEFGSTANTTAAPSAPPSMFQFTLPGSQNSQNSFTQSTTGATAPTNSPFTFGGFNSNQTTSSLPQIASQTQPSSGAQFNLGAFSGGKQISFNFGASDNTAAAPAPPGTTPPVFQFSADQLPSTAGAVNRNIKKAKRRLNPT